MPFARLQASHVMTTTPAAGAILTNAGTRTTGGMENIGTATSETFTMAETITCTELVNAPISGYPSNYSSSWPNYCKFYIWKNIIRSCTSIICRSCKTR